MNQKDFVRELDEEAKRFAVLVRQRTLPAAPKPAPIVEVSDSILDSQRFNFQIDRTQ